MVGWMVDEWTDGLLDEWVEGGWKDGWIDGWKKNSIGNSLHTKVRSKSNNRCRRANRANLEMKNILSIVLNVASFRYLFHNLPMANFLSD